MKEQAQDRGWWVPSSQGSSILVSRVHWCFPQPWRKSALPPSPSEIWKSRVRRDNV